jgi:GNAT superfamily N-acetyltransferase
MTENLNVRQAVAGDMPTIVAMIDEAADWLRAKGTDQWARPWPTRKHRDRRIQRGLKRNKTWMVENEGLPVATVTLRRRGNRKLWTAAERHESAVYLSRLVVRRDYAGQGIGEALVDWAGVRGRRGWGAQWIRIDVWTTNVALHNYYAKRGFRPYGDQRPAKINNYPSAALFQKPVSGVDEEAAARFAEGPIVGGRGQFHLFRVSSSRGTPEADQPYGRESHPRSEGPTLPVVHRTAARDFVHETSGG